MGLPARLSRTRVLGLAAVLVTGGVLLAQTTQAAAAPAPTTPATSSTSTSAAHPSSTTPTRRPQATAPQPPADHGPPCTTNADKLYPVVCLPDGSGEDRTGQLTAGENIEFDAQVVNNGPAVADANIVITLPKGLQLESDEDGPVYRIDGWYTDDEEDGDYTDLTCTALTSTITCAVGALEQGANILIGIDLQAGPDVTAGTTLSFQVALQPVVPGTFAATSVTASLAVVEPAHLVVSLTPATVRAVVGHSATVTAAIHNAGPGTAADTFAFAIDADQNSPKNTHFVITNGIDATQGGGGAKTVGVVVAGSSRARARLQQQALTRAAAVTRRHALPSLRFWPVGTLAPGATTRIPIKLRATSEGEDSLLFAAQSQTGDPACDSGDGGDNGSASATPLARPADTTTAPGACQDTVTTLLTAVLPSAAAASGSASGSEPLADTGTHGLDLQLGVAVWAIVLGGLLVWVGRRRFAAGNHRG